MAVYEVYAETTIRVFVGVFRSENPDEEIVMSDEIVYEEVYQAYQPNNRDSIVSEHTELDFKEVDEGYSDKIITLSEPIPFGMNVSYDPDTGRLDDFI